MMAFVVGTVFLVCAGSVVWRMLNDEAAPASNKT
jgi:hypothetical protein